MITKPKALIFDFDGLIVDTEVPIFDAWQTDYAEYGQELSLEDYVGCVGSDFGGFDPRLHLCRYRRQLFNNLSQRRIPDAASNRQIAAGSTEI